MKSYNPLTRKTMIKNTISSNALVFLFYFGTLIISNILPYYLILREDKGSVKESTYNFYNNSLLEVLPYEFYLVISASIIITLIVFNPLFKKENIIAIHSMPTNNSQIYMDKVISAWLMFSIPLVLNIISLVIISLIYQPQHIGFIITFGVIFLMLGSLIVFLLALSGSLTGASSIQVLMAISIITLPGSFIFLVHTFMKRYVQGYIGTLFNLNMLDYRIWEFYGVLVEASYNGEVSRSQALGYMFVILGIFTSLSLLLIIVGRYTYSNRFNENQTWINREWAKRLVTISFAVFTSVTFATLDLFHILKEESFLNTFISSILGLIAGYLFGVFISRQNLDIRKRIKEFIISFSIIYIGFMLVILLANVYYTNIPSEKTIKYVNFMIADYGEDYYFDYIYDEDNPFTANQEMFYSQEFKEKYTYLSDVSIEEANNKNEIYNFVSRSLDNSAKDNVMDIYIEYTLNNGRKVKRYYKNVLSEEYLEPSIIDPSLNELYTSMEYIEKSSPLIPYDSELIESIVLKVFNEHREVKEEYHVDDNIIIGEIINLAKNKDIHFSTISDLRSNNLLIVHYKDKQEEFTTFARINSDVNSYLDIININ